MKNLDSNRVIERRRPESQDAHAKKQTVLKCIANVFLLEKCALLSVHVMGATIILNIKRQSIWQNNN
jgi:hypothetical protein